MSQTGAYKLRQFTEPISRHVISTVQKLIKWTGTNGPKSTQARLRHQGSSFRRTLPRCRVLLGSPDLIFQTFISSSSLSLFIFPSHNMCHLLNPITRECQKHSTSTDTIALSRAYDPYILVIREF